MDKFRKGDDIDTESARDARVKTTRALADERTVAETTVSSRTSTDLALDAERKLNESRINARDELLMVLSHDLKNSLSSITLNASFIMQEAPVGETGNKIRGRTKAIQRRLAEMERLISSLLDAEFIIAGKLPMKMAQADLSVVAQDTISEFLSLAEYSSITLELHAPEHHVFAMCDSLRIHQVLSNLLSNAIKFAVRNSTVDVTLEEVDQMARFTVTNVGKTIPVAHRSEIFERFVKLENPLDNPQRNPVMGGRGLGLWISRWIVSQHEGKIGVEATPVGNSFVFTLPV